MKLLLCLACLTFAWAGELSPDCKEGPSSWCRDLSTAAKCGQVAYCHENAWKDQAKAVSCEVCTFVATVMDALLKQNKTQEEAMAFFETVCNSLGSLSTECHTLVSKDFYIIWDLVVEEVDPSVICYKLGYCTISKAAGQQPQSGSVECDLCTFVAQYLDKLMENNITKVEAENDVQKLCVYLGSFESECDAFIQMNFDSVWAYLESDLQPDIICVKLNVCASSVRVMEATSKPTESNCEMCTLIATYLDALVKKNITKLEGESLVMSLCGYLPEGLGPECDQFVEAHFDTVWELLEKDLEPSFICVKLNICTAYVQPAMSALSSHQPEGFISCEECKFLIDAVHSEVTKPATQAEAMMIALKVCSDLGGLNFLCSIIVNDTFDTIWATLVNDLSDSTNVCVFLEKCTKGAPKQLLGVPATPVSTPSLAQDPPCDLCLALVNFVIDLGEKDNATIEKFAYAFCGSLDDPVLVSTCENLINTTFIDAWTMILKGMNATKLCQQLNKCPLSTKTSGISDAAGCQLCNAVVEYIEYKAAMNTTEAHALLLAQFVCTQLGSLSELCNEVINKSFDQIWKRFLSDLSLSSLACQFKFCSSGKMELALPSQVPQATSIPRAVKRTSGLGYTECDLCKLVAYVLDSVAMNNATEQEAKVEVEKLCSLLGTYGPLCTEFVASNFQAIWGLIVKDLEPSFVCVHLKLCNATVLQAPSFVDRGSVSKSLPTVTTCEVCKVIAFMMDSLVKNNVSEVDAKAFMIAECGKLGVYTQMCVILVNEYFEDIWNLLINDLEPDFICAKLGLCSNSTFTQFGLEQPVACTACEEMLVGMEGVVDENTTEDEAYTLMEMFCNVLPPEITSKCKDLVAADFFLAWDMFKECVDNPKNCCIKIGVCNSTSIHTNLFEDLLTEKAIGGSAKGNGSAFLCVLCEYVMKELDSILAENATEATLNKVCSLIPKSLTSYCDRWCAHVLVCVLKPNPISHIEVLHTETD
ncbi:hypothetical protein EMCRGX_G030802 [Ephydatia muelleri]